MPFRISIVTILTTIHLVSSVASTAADVEDRSLKIAVTAKADSRIEDAANRVFEATSDHPLLKLLCGSSAPTQLHTTESLMNGPIDQRAFDHLILMGLPEDPMIERAWQNQARRIEGGLYVFGFGHLKGDIGLIESDRNPFLHSQQVRNTPYETQVIVLTGNTSAGIALAVDMFLSSSLINGVVAADGWSRNRVNLLQRDPLTNTIEIPSFAVEGIGGYTRIGWTQASEDEYRAVLADTGVKPVEIQRWKYYGAKAWDTPLLGSQFKDSKVAWNLFLAGLNRRAFGNSLWLARFASPEQAAQAAERITPTIENVGSRQHSGAEPPQAEIWCAGDTVVMSTLPIGVNLQMR